MDAVYAQHKLSAFQIPFTEINILEYLPHGDILKHYRKINKYFNDATSGTFSIDTVSQYTATTIGERIGECPNVFFSDDPRCFLSDALSVSVHSLTEIPLLSLSENTYKHFKDWTFSTITPCSWNVVAAALWWAEMDASSPTAGGRLPRIPRW